MTGMFSPYPQFHAPVAPSPPPQGGQFVCVNTLDEVQAAPLPMNGAKMLFLMNNAPVVYLAYMQDGQKMISGFSLVPIVAGQAQEKRPPTLEERMAGVENAIATLAAKLGGNGNGQSAGNHVAGAAQSETTGAVQPVAAGQPAIANAKPANGQS